LVGGEIAFDEDLECVSNDLRILITERAQPLSTVGRNRRGNHPPRAVDRNRNNRCKPWGGV
jgi:hypothetical protein